MADDDTLVMPDSVRTPAPVQDAALDAQAPEPDAQASPDDGAQAAPDDAGTQAAEPDDKTAKRVADTEAALKEKQAELTRVSQEIALQKAIKKQLDARQAPAPKQEEKDYLDDPEWVQRFEEDPTAAVREIQRNERARLKSTFEARDEYLMGQFKRMLDERTDPARLELQGQLATLAAEIPGFEDIPAQTQIAMAKKFADATPSKPDTRRPPATGPAGTGRPPPPVNGPSQRQKAAQAAHAAIPEWNRGDSDLDQYPFGKPAAAGVQT